MLDPVSHRGYSAYGKINAQMGMATENGEKFALGQEGMEKDDSQKKGKKKVGEADGVVVELSGQSGGKQGRGADTGAEPGAAGLGTDFTRIGSGLGALGSGLRLWGASLARLVTNFFSGLRKAVSDFWNSDSPAAPAGAEEIVETEIVFAEDRMGEEGAADEDGVVADVTEETVISDEAPLLLLPALPVSKGTEGDPPEQMPESPGDTGQVRYVKDSDLLTHYDRRGKLVRLNGADRDRILHGERSARRYRR